MRCQLAHALYSHSFRLSGEAVASQSVCRFYLVIGGGEGGAWQGASNRPTGTGAWWRMERTINSLKMKIYFHF